MSGETRLSISSIQLSRILAVLCSYVIIIIRLLLRASEGDPPLLLPAVALRDVDEILPHVPRAAHQVEEVLPRDAECLAALVADARDLVRVRVRVKVRVRLGLGSGFG